MAIDIKEYRTRYNKYIKAQYEFQEVQIAYDNNQVEWDLLSGYEFKLNQAISSLTFFKLINNIGW